MASQGTGRAFDPLGLSEPSKVELRPLGGVGPQLDVSWGSFHQGIGSSLAAVFGRPLFSRKLRQADFFRDCWIDRRMPRRAIVAAALWHIAFVVFPHPNFPARPRPAIPDPQWQLTWSGSINDLPPLNLPGRMKKPRPRGEPSKPLPPKGADAFHPRQTIISDPIRPTHPRQTLINPAAPPEPPKLLPILPNIVQLTQDLQPARPRLQISREALAKLRPRLKSRRQATEVAAPDLPKLDPHVADVNIAASPNAPARPKLELNAGSAPRFGPRAQRGDASAPELAPAVGAPGSAPSTLIALSASPAPPAPVVQVPQGNLSARISISPEGTRPGALGNLPDGALGSEGGTTVGAGNGIALANAPSVSISGGNPSAASNMSGLSSVHPLIGLPRAMLGRPVPGRPSPDAPDADRKSTAEIALMHPGARPEEAFGPRRVYTLHVNTPNLNSASGSWILNFVELRGDPSVRPLAGELSGPVPLRKVDPKYPPALVSEKVEGEVVLYAVIRKDGSVDSIQLIHGIDAQLDNNAMQALSKWKFRPAEHQGVPVELEAIVHIPFRAVARPY